MTHLMDRLQAVMPPEGQALHPGCSPAIPPMHCQFYASPQGIAPWLGLLWIDQARPHPEWVTDKTAHPPIRRMHRGRDDKGRLEKEKGEG